MYRIFILAVSLLYGNKITKLIIDFDERTGEAFTRLLRLTIIGPGVLYWIWLSIKFKSFGMFIIGFFPPLLIITVPVGYWSLIFDIPKWLIEFFG
tara:strand:- start:90 stop:374 length:285 start_codon:yes stop_codon:yes gene_type:complete